MDVFSPGVFAERWISRSFQEFFRRGNAPQIGIQIVDRVGLRASFHLFQRTRKKDPLGLFDTKNERISECGLHEKTDLVEL